MTLIREVVPQLYIGIRDFGFYFPKNSGGLNRVLLFPM